MTLALAVWRVPLLQFAVTLDRIPALTCHKWPQRYLIISDGPSLDFAFNWNLPVIHRPMLLNVFVEVFFLAVSDEGFCSTARADDS
jgi:hypothetical protein